jgi:D-aminopeptidase
MAIGSQRKVLEPRARELGIPFDGDPGTLDAITDVAGVEVGHTTIIRGDGKLKVGRGPVRTGVTAILPRGKRDASPVFAGYFSLNGNGEMTGTAWVEESGMLTTPIMITNTHSVGVVRDGVIAWQLAQRTMTQPWSLPVVAETRARATDASPKDASAAAPACLAMDGRVGSAPRHADSIANLAGTHWECWSS